MPAAALVASELCRRQACAHDLDHSSNNSGNGNSGNGNSSNGNSANSNSANGDIRPSASKWEIPALVALASARPAGAAAILAQCGLSSASNSSSNWSRGNSINNNNDDDVLALRYAVLRAMGSENKSAVMSRMPENDQAVLARYAAANDKEETDVRRSTENSSGSSNGGSGEPGDASSSSANGGTFGWVRKPLHELPEKEAIGQGCAFAHRLQFKTEHGEPIAVWRLGLVGYRGIRAIPTSRY